MPLIDEIIPRERKRLYIFQISFQKERIPAVSHFCYVSITFAWCASLTSRPILLKQFYRYPTLLTLDLQLSLHYLSTR
jgi:hypothetical protein